MSVKIVAAICLSGFAAISCSAATPNCSDPEVLQLVKELFAEQMDTVWSASPHHVTMSQIVGLPVDKLINFSLHTPTQNSHDSESRQRECRVLYTLLLTDEFKNFTTIDETENRLVGILRSSIPLDSDSSQDYSIVMVDGSSEEYIVELD